MTDQIDEAQMAADFATIPDPVDGPMRRARILVEAHISDYGMVPHPDRIKEAISIELGLAEIRGIDRGKRVGFALLEEGARKMGNEERVQWKKRVGDYLAALSRS